MRSVDHAPVNRVLTRLAKRAQRSGGSITNLSLDSKTLPELFLSSSGEDADFVWSLVKEAVAEGLVLMKLKPTKQICAEYEREPKLVLAAEKLPALLEILGLAPSEPSYREQWAAALLAGLGAPASVAEALSAYDIRIDGKSPSEIVAALNQLLTLKEEPLLLREASGRVFWGMSKVLDGRGEMMAKLFEVEECPFPPSALHVMIHLPQEGVSGVLFVENQTTFEVLERSDNPALYGMALIFCAGFKGAARRLTNRSQVSCYASEGSSASTRDRELVQSFLFDRGQLPCYFYGDLDYSGMAILKSLRRSFPAITAWEPGYALMVARLRMGHGHTPRASGKEGQIDPQETGCPLADGVLLPAMRELGLFVDQEY